MDCKSYYLMDDQKERMKEATHVAISIPFIDSIEDYIWEAIFCYAKDIPIIDPFSEIRSKKLYDVVDAKNAIGWSAKALQCSNPTPLTNFEIVIQRADIFKKQRELGFSNLSKDSDPNELGEAILKHWRLKVEEDAVSQHVNDRRICILLKNSTSTKFAYLEEDIVLYDPSDITWNWTNANRVGLQGCLNSTGECKYRWYPNQKQLFERFTLPADSFTFSLETKRLSIAELISKLH